MKALLAELALMACLLTVVGAPAPNAPKVVSTSPAAWAVNVSPGNQKPITISFDRPMASGYTAWMGPSAIVPQSAFDSKTSADRLSFTIAADLQPGKVYVLALNEEGIAGVGFQTLQGVSLPPHFLVFQTAGTPAPTDAPPRVVSTVPAQGAQQVDPLNTRSITVAFDKAMDPKKHGVQMTESGKPVDLATARFQYSPDGRTFGLAYDFKRSTTYEVTLNSVTNIGFASTSRIPLWPVRFSFTTAQPQ